MPTANNRIMLSRVQNEASIPAIARTVNAAFSSDPLIQWLRPNALPWSRQSSEALKWQYRRVQTIMAHGIVLQSSSISQMGKENPCKGNEGKILPASEDTQSKVAQVTSHEHQVNVPEQDTGAVVFLFPPKEDIDWSLTRIFMKCKVWLLNLLKPVDDEGKAKRVSTLMSTHETLLQSLQQKYEQRLWHLEVIAVHPNLQSRGIGRRVMQCILEHAKGQPVYLECTQYENLGFYKKLGFSVIEEVELSDDDCNDEDATVKYWAMIRAGDHQQ